jgi:hypothetical protein
LRAIAVIAVFASLVHVSATAASESSLRCAGGLVGLGDATIDLLGKCGAPALREPRVDEAWVAFGGGGSSVQRRVLLAVERWTYDFGPQRFLMFVTLEMGKVVGIERGGYGYAEAPPPPVAIRRATCDTSALHVGDAKLDLLARCGEPAAVDTRQESEVRVAADVGAVVAMSASPTDLEVWTYDFGPNTLLRFVVLENGVVTRIDTGSHGYGR